MKKNLAALLLTLYVLSAASCEDCRTVACDPYRQWELTLHDFVPESIDLVIVKAYEKGQPFSIATRKDSLALKKGDNMILEEDGKDRQTVIVRRKDNKHLFDSRYDYVVEIPATGSRWEIDQLTDIQQEMEYNRPSLQRKTCNNAQLRSSRVNGQLIERPVIPALTR
jgi:hypothetical protein